MPRDGGGQYYLPPGTEAAPDTTIESTRYNVFTADVEEEFNRQIDKDTSQDAAIAGALTPAAADAAYVNVGGDTMTGHLSLPTGPAAANAVRKDYVDTAIAGVDLSSKVAKAGDTMTGDLIINKSDAALDLRKPDASSSAAINYKTNNLDRWAVGTANPPDDFYVVRYNDAGAYVDTPLTINRSTGTATFGGPVILNADPTVALGATTKQYVDAADAAVTATANGKVSKSGDSMSGNLTVNADIYAIRGGGTTGVIYFGSTGGTRYLYFDGSNYQFGGAGTAWHTGNLNPAVYVSNGRLAYAGDVAFPSGMSEPYGGAVQTGMDYPGGLLRYRYMQLLTSGWFTIGYV